MVTRTLVLLLDERVHIDGRDLAQKVDVFVRMKLRHLTLCGGFGPLRDTGDVSSILGHVRKGTGLHTKISMRL